MKLKITSLTEESITKYYANGILVATVTSSIFWTYSKKALANRTRVYDLQKIGFICEWIEVGLNELLKDTGKSFKIGYWKVDDSLIFGHNRPNFENSKPNERTGWHGKRFSKFYILSTLKTFLEKDTK